jgi:glycosyltransferase involved in cell wall biosynthesis
LPETVNILTEVGCGITVDPNNLLQIKEAISRLLKNPKERDEMGKKAMAAHKSKYNWKYEEKKLAAIYKEILEF